MQFDEAKRTLEVVNATKTEYDEARGFMPRKPSDPPPPTVHLYMLDDKIRLEIVVDHDTNAIRTMVIRFEPNVRAHIKANYFEVRWPRTGGTGSAPSVAGRGDEDR